MGGGWGNQVLGIKAGTCEEHQVMCGGAESLCCTPDTNITLDVN